MPRDTTIELKHIQSTELRKQGLADLFRDVHDDELSFLLKQWDKRECVILPRPVFDTLVEIAGFDVKEVNGS
jgi:hypothetical protein